MCLPGLHIIKKITSREMGQMRRSGVKGRRVSEESLLRACWFDRRGCVRFRNERALLYSLPDTFHLSSSPINQPPFQMERRWWCTWFACKRFQLQSLAPSRFISQRSHTYPFSPFANLGGLLSLSDNITALGGSMVWRRAQPSLSFWCWCSRGAAPR